ncbi:MAG: amino acid ABC transporter permease [Dehalococcoidia bacterium]
MTAPLALPAARPGTWLRDTRVRRALLEAVTIGLVSALAIYIAARAQAAGGVDLAFMEDRAGFGVGDQFLTEVSGRDSRWMAFLAGLLNTLRVTLFGIVISMTLGLGLGIARLSTNWLAAKLAFGYVEFVRNMPLPVFVVFCYTAVVLRLPRIQDSFDVAGVAYFSNRSVALPWLSVDDGAALWGVVVLGGALAAWVTHRVLAAREEDTGRPSYPVRAALGLLAIAIVGGYVATGMPAAWDVPKVGRFQYDGGLQLSPEFFGLLLALSLFNAAFVAEIVRGAISAVPRGEREAAAALGLSSWQQLRLVVLPQAMRVMLPPLATQAQNLAKMSSVAIVVAFPDLMNVGGTIINNSGEAIPVFILMTVTYFVLNLAIALLFIGPQWRTSWSRGRRA